MNHQLSPQDHAFQSSFESAEYPLADFDHRGHLRLAYIYLAQADTEQASQQMRQALQHYLAHHGVDPKKYHETITRAWILAVQHFMSQTGHAASADAFIDQHPQMLDPNIMLTHYSAELLFSDDARKAFTEPDLDPIPRHDG